MAGEKVSKFLFTMKTFSHLDELDIGSDHGGSYFPIEEPGRYREAEVPKDRIPD